MRYFSFVWLFIFVTFLQAAPLSIQPSTNLTALLPHSQIYIDKSNHLTIEDILQKDMAFQDNDKNVLSFGYSPNFSVWVKFTLKNDSPIIINKLIEYDNTLSTDIYFFDPDKQYDVQKEGLLHIQPHRKTLTPTFNITLKPGESKTYYLKAFSNVTTLILSLNLWNKDIFYENEISHQFALALFFGAMVSLGLYNLFIFFYTRDISYLFYVAYIVGIIFHQVIYVGISPIYLFDPPTMSLLIQNASLVVLFPILSLALFIKTFIQTQQYPLLNRILHVCIVFIVISAFFITFTDALHRYRSLIALIALLYLLCITIYAVYKRNRQAYFIFLGWCVVFTAVALMTLSSSGYFDIQHYIPYYIEFALLFEAAIFSVALGDRIKQVQIQNVRLDKELILQQSNEKQRLEEHVLTQTEHLQMTLDEKQLLLRELHHRVKNNMQTMVSLIRLQSTKVKDKSLKNVLVTIQNRINAMSHLHELLYKQENLAYVNTYEYFSRLIKDIQRSYDGEFIVSLDIQAELQVEQAIYSGLILNELVTNAFKYAFIKEHGTINVILRREKDMYFLTIRDDGTGYDQNQSRTSLGLTLVNELATKQLKGTISTETSNGTITTISWKEK